MRIEVKIRVGGKRLSLPGGGQEVRDPSVVTPVGRVAALRWEGDDAVISIDLDDDALAARLSASERLRGAF